MTSQLFYFELPLKILKRLNILKIEYLNEESILGKTKTKGFSKIVHLMKYKNIADASFKQE